MSKSAALLLTATVAAAISWSSEAATAFAEMARSVRPGGKVLWGVGMDSNIVAASLKAYDRGRAVVVTGIVNQMTAAFSTVSPGVVTRKIAGRVMAEAASMAAR